LRIRHGHYCCFDTIRCRIGGSYVEPVHYCYLGVSRSQPCHSIRYVSETFVLIISTNQRTVCLPTVRPACLYLFTCTNPSSTVGSGSNSYGPRYGRSQTKNTIRLSTLPNGKDNDESSSTHQLAESERGGRGSMSDFESHAMDRYRGNLSTVTGPSNDQGSDEFTSGSPFGGIMVKNETTVRVSTAR
jgi:hypothetical protein